MANTMMDNPIVDYLKEHVRNYEGLHYWSLAMGVQGVMERMGWSSCEHRWDDIGSYLRQCRKCGDIATIEVKHSKNKKVPALCLKTYNTYDYCPLVLRHEDEMILSYISMLAEDIKRANGNGVEEVQAIYRHCCEITAYMNGRIHELVNRLKEFT